MADDIVWEICRNHYMIVECPYIADWRNTLIIQESRAQVDLLEATENVKLCNWGAGAERTPVFRPEMNRATLLCYKSIYTITA